jgi:hypothetical protein
MAIGGPLKIGLFFMQLIVSQMATFGSFPKGFEKVNFFGTV